MPETRSPAIRMPAGTQRMRWGELYGSSAAYFLAEAASRSAPLVVVTGSGREADQQLAELRFYAARTAGHLVVPGPGNPALRSVFPPSGHRVRAAAHARRAAGRRSRDRRHDGRRPARPAPAARVHRGACLHAGGRRSHRPAATAQAARGRRLRAGHAGPESRRVRGAGLGRRPVTRPARRSRIASTCSTT